jgi:hypothetical protein
VQGSYWASLFQAIIRRRLSWRNIKLELMPQDCDFLLQLLPLERFIKDWLELSQRRFFRFLVLAEIDIWCIVLILRIWPA